MILITALVFLNAGGALFLSVESEKEVAVVGLDQPN